jgi:Tol biopolymer transport system component
LSLPLLDNNLLPIVTDKLTRASVASNGTEGNAESYGGGITPDGRYVVFQSKASNLVSNDTNNVSDIFVHDRQTSVTTRISVASDGAQANGLSEAPSMSADGRYVAYSSEATNLDGIDTNDARDIFVHDRQTGQTKRITTGLFGLQTDGDSSAVSISDDGRFIAFQSQAGNLVVGDSNEDWDVFVYDLQTGETTRVSVFTGGAEFDSASDFPSISNDGRYVAFRSESPYIEQILVHDRETLQTTIASMSSGGIEGNDDSKHPDISGNGRYVTFVSDADNLTNDAANNSSALFLHDQETGETIRIPAGLDPDDDAFPERPSISADGRYVSFTDFIDSQMHVHDRYTGETSLVSMRPDGTPGGGTSLYPHNSADGRYIVFSSYASDLVSDDTNGFTFDVFVYDQDLD